MKKLFTIIAVAMVVCYSACDSAHNKTGGAMRDSAASYGNSGPADTSASSKSGTNGGAAGSDTSHIRDTATSPVIDSGKKR